MQRSTIESPSHHASEALASALAQEQEVLDTARQNRDRVIETIRAQLAVPSHDPVEQTRLRNLHARAQDLRNAGDSLLFGRLDALDGTTLHIGRMGIPGIEEYSDPLVIDWRAPAARPFYTATPLDTQGQARRRHVRIHDAKVIGLDDEQLDGSNPTDAVGNGALLAALQEKRTGKMGSAVATLQREQDDIVRAEASGPLIVQGGPGTGKTVVALHRVAYLLFTHQLLAARGVLVLGPSTRFLEYISQVLPALGESAMVAATPDTLIPGVRAQRNESRELAEIKGRGLWQEAIAGYVASFTPQATDFSLHWEGENYSIPAKLIERAITAARSGRSYHGARAVFAEHLFELLTDAVITRGEQLMTGMEAGLEDILGGVDAALAKDDDRGVTTVASGSDVDGSYTDDDIEQLREAIATDTRIAASIQGFWPQLDALESLRSVLASPALLTKWTSGLTDAEIHVITQEPAGLAPSDIPLLDALMHELGELESLAEQGQFSTGHATARRDWVYGHVVVDEAQELSHMQWQMVVRRCPTKSITAVGDIDQTEAPHQHTSWAESVSAPLGERWREARLSISYRTPTEVMELTHPVLRLAKSSNTPPRAVRSSGITPWEHSITEEELISHAAGAARELTERWDGGLVGVIAPVHRVQQLKEALPGIAVLSATEAKGLEWDATLLVDPAGIAAEPRGYNGLYVALTRCTQELGQLVLVP